MIPFLDAPPTNLRWSFLLSNSWIQDPAIEIDQVSVLRFLRCETRIQRILVEKTQKAYRLVMSQPAVLLSLRRPITLDRHSLTARFAPPPLPLLYHLDPYRPHRAANIFTFQTNLRRIKLAGQRPFSKLEAGTEESDTRHTI
jgi:hypothetical protein